METFLFSDSVPVEYDEVEFVWDAYLEETGALPAPPTAFTHVSIQNDIFWVILQWKIRRFLNLLYIDISYNIYTELNTTDVQIGCIHNSNSTKKLNL